MATTLRLDNMEAYERLVKRDTKPTVPGSNPWPHTPETTGSFPAAKKHNPRGGRHEPGRMNKSETFYSMNLDMRKAAGEVKSWMFEAITIRLAKGCSFTPDFAVWMKNDDLVFVEVKRLWKGEKKPHYEDDALVKIKWAADLFRGLHAVYGVHWDGEKWVYELF